MEKVALSQILNLRQFVNTLTADDKYSRHNKENFPKQIHMQLSQKPKTVSDLFIAFLKSTSNSRYFEKEDVSISGIIDSEGGAYLNI